MPNSPAKILYVDDDPALGRLVQKVLGRQGRDIVHVTFPQAGLERLAVGDIDVLVLDHYLAEGTGLDMLKDVAAREDAPPVVYVTGSTEAAIAVAALKAGAADYVLKTVGEDFLELLSSAVEQAIQTSRLHKARERAEREMREARERAELALAEVNHRVANSLALVAALVRMQMSAVADPAAKEALAETQGRISAIAGIHRRLYTTDDVRFVDIDAYLGNLASDIQATMSLDGSAADIKLLAEPLRMPTDKAVSVGVIVNELVTNAAKYAYRDREAGEIRVRANQLEPGKIEIVVEDDGIGWMGEGKIHGTGVGSRVIAATASGLGATLAYETVPRGTRARLQIEI
jgi:two-component sensor histidine kinase/CheY-like chemotaxis protein